MDPASGTPSEGESFRREGDFSYWVDNAQIATVSWCGQEIIRRLFVTVRDRNWRETPATEWDVKPLSDGSGLALKALHRSPTAEFEWEGTFRVRQNTLTFRIDGRTLRDMDVCRVGLVVLYPVRSLFGSLVQVGGPYGTHSLQIHEQLYPQRLIDNLPRGMTPPFSSLSIKFREGGSLQCRFAGELFELEDQRNWGDASFKAYCTPLNLGFPRRITSGAVVRHEMEATLAMETPPVRARPSPAYEIRRAENTAQKTFVFPRLGVYATVEAPLARESLYTHWSHIRIDILGSDAYPSVTKMIDRLPPSEGIELCLAIDESGPTNHVLDDLFKRLKSPIVRLLVREAGTGLPSERNVARLRELLATLNVQTPPLFAVSNGYFVEINRENPLPKLDGIAFPFSSTVHLSDRWTIAESPAVLTDMAASACKLMDGSRVAISPLALFHPATTETDTFPASMVAPWVLATLIAAARSQVSSLTLAADLVAALSAEKSHSVLERLRRWSERPLLPLARSESENVYAVYVDNAPDPDEVVIVNLRRTPINVCWHEKGLTLDHIVNASNGIPIDTHESRGIQLSPATAIVASLARPQWPRA